MSKDNQLPCGNYQPTNDRDVPTDPDGARVCKWKSIAKLTEENPHWLDELEVVIRWRSKHIEICWPKHRSRTPYSIGFDRAQTLADIMGWMAHLSQKTWFEGTVARDLSRALIEVYNKQRGQ